ncbi:MAG: type II secretion system F family protein [Nitrososphaerales archaeon]
MRLRLISIISGAIAALTLGYYGFVNYFPSYSFHIFLGFSLIVALAPLAVVKYLEDLRKRAIDEMLPQFLDDLGEAYSIGLTLFQAIEESSKRDYGPLTKELKKLVIQLSWGSEFEKSFLSFSKRIGTELVRKTSALLLEALRLGGDLKVTFSELAKFVRRLLELNRERESQFRPYLLIIYVSVLIFVVVAIILYQSFFAPILGEQTEARFLRVPIKPENFKSLFLDMAIMEAIFGGLTIGKLGEGSYAAGLKHAVILLVAVTLAFIAFF